MKAVYEKLRQYHKENKSYDEDYEENIAWYEELLSLVPEERRELTEQFLQDVDIDKVDTSFLLIDILFNYNK